MMDMIKTLTGMIQLEIISADLPGLLQVLMGEGITVFDLVSDDELHAHLTISRSEYKRLLRLCEKRGASVMVKGKKGLYWAGRQLLRRPFLLLGILCLLAAVLYLPTRVFFVQVEGNVTLPARRIIAAAEECGIGFGASRREVRSERVKNALLDAIPELQWAGVNTRGCVAVISVRERAESKPPEETSGYGNLVAIRDGVVTSCTATRGSLLCAPGQAVFEGQVLISGYTDCGLCIRSERAEGEVYGQTLREISAAMPSIMLERTKSMGNFKKISLLIGKKRINLWKDSGISDTTCDRMYEEYYVTLPGGFRLPIAIVVERYRDWEVQETAVPIELGESVLKDFAANYLGRQMIAGMIKSRDESVVEEDGVYVLNGKYVCEEMIAKLQQEQIGAYDGKNN